ncbi:iron chaperone [Emticicia sp. SJ17W-69]|uniref:iron chaperone n=1 Tax=Emticicia sp. SJ17W-69 TaxID=3421657 RepID=UPI003EBD5D0E
MENSVKDTDSYIDTQPENIRPVLQQLRQIIKEIVPEAEEVISYQMPAFKQNGMLVWYAGYKNHIGFYPSSTPIVFFKEELKAYKTSKGAIQLPLDKPLPVELITKIVKFKIEENTVKALTKTKKK